MNKGINKSRESLASWSDYNHCLLTCMLIYLRHSLQTPWIKLSSKTINKSNQSTTRIQQCKPLTDALRYIAAKKIGEEKGRKYLVHTQEKRRTGTENNSRRKIFCLLRRISNICSFFYVSKVLLIHKELCVIHQSVPFAICHLLLTYKKGN